MNTEWNGPPPYFLRVMDKSKKKSRTIAGAAFPVAYGQFNIVLNPGITIDWKDEVWLTLVPNPKVKEGKLDHATGEDQAPSRSSEDDFPL